jgi:endonuclease-3
MKKPADVARASRPLLRERPAPASRRGQDARGTAAETPALRRSAKPKTNYLSPERLQKIFSALDQLFPQARCALQHENAFQLLVATILSAQCTDERVNKVTPGLFQKYSSPQDFAALAQPVLEEEIRSTGFFRNKAKNIIGMAKKLVTDFGGQVPRTMEQMLTLPGVARKTANVVLGTAYGITTGIVVDTHVFRVARRLKLSREKTPEKVEQDLLKLVPPERWIAFGHQMIWFGRKVCQARKPLCADCLLESICDSRDKSRSRLSG